MTPITCQHEAAALPPWSLGQETSVLCPRGSPGAACFMHCPLVYHNCNTQLGSRRLQSRRDCHVPGHHLADSRMAAHSARCSLRARTVGQHLSLGQLALPALCHGHLRSCRLPVHSGSASSARREGATCVHVHTPGCPPEDLRPGYPALAVDAQQADALAAGLLPLKAARARPAGHAELVCAGWQTQQAGAVNRSHQCTNTCCRSGCPWMDSTWNLASTPLRHHRRTHSVSKCHARAHLMPGKRLRKEAIPLLRVSRPTLALPGRQTASSCSCASATAVGRDAHELALQGWLAGAW